MQRKVAALFVDPMGVYPELLGAENCWDEQRDARTYAGPDPVVAHPPCNRWCAMARVNQKRWGFQVGADGGIFASALTSLYDCGGVLEHPANSLAWPAYGLPRPRGVGWSGGNGVWVCEVWQSAYGHPCHKRTWLLYVGPSRPAELDWRRDKSLATHQVGGGVHTGNRSMPRCPDALTHITPPAFAKALIGLACNAR
jgi:hypothetical protein